MQWPLLWKDLPSQADDGEDDASQQPAKSSTDSLNRGRRTSTIGKKDSGGAGGEGSRQRQSVSISGSASSFERKESMSSVFLLSLRVLGVIFRVRKRDFGGFRKRDHLPSSVVWNTLSHLTDQPSNIHHIKLDLCPTSQSYFAKDLMFSFMEYLWLLFYRTQWLFCDLRADYSCHWQRSQTTCPRSCLWSLFSKGVGSVVVGVFLLHPR